MRFQVLLKEKRDDILRLAVEHGAKDIRVFGSVARGEAHDQSDIDFLVEMEPGRSLLDMGGATDGPAEAVGLSGRCGLGQGLSSRSGGYPSRPLARAVLGDFHHTAPPPM